MIHPVSGAMFVRAAWDLGEQHGCSPVCVLTKGRLTRREDILSLVSRDSLAKRGKDWTVESRVTWTQNSPKKFLCCGGQEIVPPNVQVNEWPSIWTLQRKDRCTFLLNRNRVKPILKLFKIS